MEAKKVMRCLGCLVPAVLTAATLEIETGTSYHCAVRPATNLTARIEVDGDTPVQWKGAMEFRDYFGHRFFVSVEDWGAKGKPIRVKLPEPPGMGIWRGKAWVKSTAGAIAEAKATFAVLDPHPVTPLAPRDSFRFGINYHIIRYHKALRQQTMDALVGVGAKLMRGNFAPHCFVQPQEGVFKWEQTDELVRELLAHGIAIDAIIPTVPQWAKDPAYASLTNGPTWAVPTKPGVAEAYGRALAARYGTKIEYYEIGNEPDLYPKSHMPIEKAIERQRDYYRGIKSACPEAKVIPGGWALCDSSSWMISQKGFQERFMKEAQDVCDFHPIHMHASYEKYRKEMLKFFAWREKEGVTIPWYANETAASSCHGQEDSAAMWVWQKSLWSWAHGSVDYIWYNLRSIGPDPNNGEHAYGIFTMDMQPRATAAAFSVLTAVFNGQEFDKILCDMEASQLYVFKGKLRGCEVEKLRGCEERTVVGWDAFVRQPRTVVLETDAKACESVDLMGNRRAVEVKDGMVSIALDRFPRAYVLKGATRVAARGRAGNEGTERPLAEVLIKASEQCPEMPSLVLDSMASYKGFCDGNADTEHRLWKGPQDLSVKLFVWKPQWQTVHARVVVTDDVMRDEGRGMRDEVGGKREEVRGEREEVGDHVRIVFNGEKRMFAPTRVENGAAVYEFDLPWHAVPGPFTFEVYDDDGEGLDGYLGGDGYLLKYE